MLSDTQKRQLCRCYPKWKDQIEKGDFQIEVRAGEKSVVWTNTAIFAPSLLDANAVISSEFRAIPHRLIKFRVVGISFTVTGPSAVQD